MDVGERERERETERETETETERDRERERVVKVDRIHKHEDIERMMQRMRDKDIYDDKSSFTI